MGRRKKRDQVERADAEMFAERVNMHPRNKYAKNPPDFAELAAKHAFFSEFVTKQNGIPSVDFKNSDALRGLTRVLLKSDYGIDWSLPQGHLVPPVTNRANYIHWIEDLMDSESRGQNRAPSAAVGARPATRGVDIGTGASLIYPLIGCALNPNWSFVGTDISSESLDHAQSLIESNNLTERIQLRLVDPELMLVGVLEEGERFDFCMCNPPFHATPKEVVQNPQRSQTGEDHELMTPGGEFRFVERMIEDSVKLGERIGWYTTMLGKKDNLKALKKVLFAYNILHVRTTQFSQGKTQRWGLAWSLRGHAQLTTRLENAVLPVTRAEFALSDSGTESIPEMRESFKEYLEAIGCTEISVQGMEVVCGVTREALATCGEEIEAGVSGESEGGIFGESRVRVWREEGQAVKVAVSVVPTMVDAVVEAWVRVIKNLAAMRESGDV